MATWADGTTEARTAASIEAARTPATISVKDQEYGAVGDGTTNDTAAVQEAVAALTTGDSLYFPPGSYRIATAGDAITLDGISDVSIVFAVGAELLMDNLDGSDEGTGHGVKVVGACSNVRLDRVRVRWASTPAARSLGSGFHILGYPRDSGVQAGWTGSTGTCADVHLIDCTTINAPQCGAIFMGCLRPRVENFTPVDTLADGLHFNACKDPRVNGETADNTGDDSLAFVTYYQANGNNPTTDMDAGQVGPFGLQTVADNPWANGGAQASNIAVRDGGANGVRIAGLYNASITGVTVAEKSVGVILDSGEAGGGFDWTYLASHGVVVSGVAVSDCDTGVHARVYNSDSSDSATYWRHDVLFSDLVLRDCDNRCLRTEGSGGQNSVIAGVSFRGVRAYGSDVSFSSYREGHVTDVRVVGGGLQFYGKDVDHTGAMSGLARHNVTVDDVTCDGEPVLFQDCRGYSIGNVRSDNSATDGVIFNRVLEATVESLRVVLANRGNTGTVRAILITKGQHLHIARAEVDHDANTTTTWQSLELGGGDGTDRSHDVDVTLLYRNTINGSGSGITVQGGGDAPYEWIYRARWYNAGEVSPVWRQEHYGNVTRVEHFVLDASPENDITAPVGSTCANYNGGAGTSLYIKESGTGNTGWAGV